MAQLSAPQSGKEESFMYEREKVLKIAQEWISKAENDLANAINTLKMGDRAPTDTICFHAQQCVEKYLKAVLVWNGIDFPKAHHISELMILMPARVCLPLEDREQDRLTEYATVTRYPGDYEPISVSEARRTVALARRVKKAVRQLLPREVLRRKQRERKR